MQTRYEFTVNGADLVADLGGAVYWPAAQALIVADLHFEKASAFAARGVALPPYDTAASLARLATLLQAFAPQRLISLGDAFHDDDWSNRMAEGDAARLAGLAARQETIWVTGNHDPQPPKNLPGTACPVYRAQFDGALVMRHEPVALDDDFEAGELAGHLHPCAKLRQRGRNLRRRCFIHDARRAILPAFGALTGSLNVRDAAFADLFDGRDYRAVLIGDKRLAAVDAKRLLPDK